MRLPTVLPKKFSSRLFLMTLGAGLIPIVIFTVLIQRYDREFRPEIRRTIQRAYDEQWAHSEALLRGSVETLIRQKASDVALQIDLTLEGHPYMMLRDLQQDEEFRKIAVQSFGQTGHTSVYETKTGIIRFHKDTKLQNKRPRILKRDFPALWSIIRKGYKGEYASGYYQWKGSDGETKQMFMFIVPLRRPTADNVALSVAVSTPVDEFSNPIKDAETVHNKTAVYLDVAGERLFQSFRHLGLLYMGIGIMVVSFIALGIGVYFSRAISRLRVATHEINKGNFSVSVKPSMSGEVRTLTEDFNRMVRRLAVTTVSKELLEASEQRLVDANRELQDEIIIRTATERMISTEKERLAVTLRSIKDGVITTDRAGNIVLVNEAAQALTGWSQTEAMDRSLSKIFHTIDERTRVPSEDPVGAIIKTGDSLSLERTRILIGRDRSERIIAMSGAPIRDNDNRILGVVIVFRDITGDREMGEQLLKLRKLESVSTLAGGVAHDFNNLLAVVLGNISFAKALTNPESRIYQKLTDAENATLKGKDLTYKLLVFSKGGDTSRRKTSLKEIIQDSTGLALSGSQTHCVVSVADDLCQAEINREQIEEVIHNIAMNAREATPEGGTITVRAENTMLAPYDGVPLPEGNYIKISIEDQGGGVPEEDLPRIFDPYFTTKELGNVKGMGLGLAISHSIINNHGGFMTAKSQMGVGTTLQIYLPACI